MSAPSPWRAVLNPGLVATLSACAEPGAGPELRMVGARTALSAFGGQPLGHDVPFGVAGALSALSRHLDVVDYDGVALDAEAVGRQLRLLVGAAAQ